MMSICSVEKSIKFHGTGMNLRLRLYHSTYFSRLRYFEWTRRTNINSRSPDSYQNIEFTMLSKKERKALATLDKQNAKRLEDDVRKQKNIDMRHGMSIRLLESFENDRRLKLPSGFPVAVRINVPVWDCHALLEDAQQLMTKFPSAVQYGGLHDGMWSTLCLRSMDGSTNNDCASDQYFNTSAWSESSYIVPRLLSLLTAAVAKSDDVPLSSMYSLFQRVRLSIIPPNCNVAWHVDYENTQRDGPIRMHIPIQCSDQFVLCIGGQNVVMSEGETWLGQFELPHRLCNQNSGTTRIHLVVDMFPQRKVATLTAAMTCVSFDNGTGSNNDCAEAGEEVEKVKQSDEATCAPAVCFDPAALCDSSFSGQTQPYEVPLVSIDVVEGPTDELVENLVVVPAVPVETVLFAPVVSVVDVVVMVPVVVACDMPVSDLPAVVPALPVVNVLATESMVDSNAEIVVISVEKEVVAEVPVAIKGVDELLGELDWAPLRRSEFGRAVEQAFHRLYSYPHQQPRASVASLKSVPALACEDGHSVKVNSEETGVGESEGEGMTTNLLLHDADAVAADTDGLTGECGVADTIAQCVAAFSDYRWGGPFANTTEARAAVEASYYLRK